MLDVTGWKLDDARAALTGSTPAGSTPSLELSIVETAAPPRKNAPHIFGEWRVLRARRILENSEQAIIELTIARELLEHAPHKS